MYYRDKALNKCSDNNNNVIIRPCQFIAALIVCPGYRSQITEKSEDGLRRRERTAHGVGASLR